MKEKQAVTYWTVPVPKLLNQALEEALKQSWHRTKAEFIRELVRHELMRRGFHVPGESSQYIDGSKTGGGESGVDGATCTPQPAPQPHSWTGGGGEVL